MITKVFYNLVEIVEDVIKKEMKEAGYGAIMHDGWTKFATHYVGIFAQYNRTVSGNFGKVKSTTVVQTNVLLAMRPMCAIPDQKEEEDGSGSDTDTNKEDVEEEATTFTAEVHANFFREVMRSYDINLEDWAICQVSLFFIISYI